MKQLKLLKNEKTSYGGTLLNSRKGRSQGRPLAVKKSMHLVLRSSKAKGSMSFRTPKNSNTIRVLVDRFSKKYEVKILSLANVGNHLHFHIQLGHRDSYRPFIRALTGTIAMFVTGKNRWTKNSLKKEKFWDYRPFTRVIQGFKDFLGINDYIAVNQLEGLGFDRYSARYMILPAHAPP